MREVVTHVVAAKWEHRHGIAAKLTDFTRRSSGGFAARRGAKEGSMLPVKCLGDQWHNRPSPAAEQNRVDRYAARIFPFGSDHRALASGSCEPGIRVSGLTADRRSPGPPQ